MILVHNRGSELCREVVHASRTYCRGCLAAEDDPLRKKFICRDVAVYLVVEANYVELLCEAVDCHCIVLVHSAGYRSCRVLFVADVLQPCCYSQTFRLPL